MAIALSLMGGIPAATAHVVSQLYAELRDRDGAWEMDILFDAGFADPVARNDPDSPQPDRQWLVGLDSAAQLQLTREAQAYLENTMIVESNGRRTAWTASFPDFATTPPAFPSLLNDGAYFHVRLRPAGDTDAAPVTVRVADGTHPDLVVRLPGDPPTYLTATAGGEAVVLPGPSEVAGSSPATTAFVQGVLHVVPHGLDHIFFVIGIFLLQRRWSSLLRQSLAFTAAHTITLGLAAAGKISVPGSIVEPLIALSITALAVENLFVKEPRAWRLWLVFAFGLVHGLGFAGVLSAWIRPGEGFLTTLLAANLGVEVGQVAVLATAWLVTMKWHATRAWPYFRTVSCIALGLAGLWWFAGRTGMLSFLVGLVTG